MTYVITGGCCSDSACIPVCPVQCIRPRPGDPDFTTTEQLYIDPQTCIDCGACMDECPVDAIHGEWDLPDELGDYLDINAQYFDTNPIEASSPPDPIRRRLPEARPSLAVAVVGTGPAGCYAAAELSDIKGVTVSMFDRLPTPFGLVRAGVAPDHANTKQISKRFGSVLTRPNVQCYFNVEVGKDVTLEELLEHHHAVLWAGGADSDRRLEIPGEDLPGCISAREFVAWYNGHPDYAGSSFDLSGATVVVIGNGNVALDVARILAQPVDALQKTDIADPALEVLRDSSVEEVLVTARRGPEFAAYTKGELSGLDHTDGIAICARPDEVQSFAQGADRSARILAEASSRKAAQAERRVTFRYGLRPQSISGDGAVESITFQKADGSLETVETNLVVRAIGYRGTPVDGLPFDEQSGTIPNLSGSVCDPATGESIGGMYCSGWIKRGATGIIGTNRVDSAETIDRILHDFGAGRLPAPSHDLEHLDALLRGRHPDLVDKEGWKRIDQAERKNGRRARRPRQKLVTVEELLAASRGA